MLSPSAREAPHSAPVLSLLTQALNVFTQVVAQTRRVCPCGNCGSPKTTTALSGGAVSVRQIEPVRVSSPHNWARNSWRRWPHR
jgi:hypothetical protein